MDKKKLEQLHMNMLLGLLIYGQFLCGIKRLPKGKVQLNKA